MPDSPSDDPRRTARNREERRPRRAWIGIALAAALAGVVIVLARSGGGSGSTQARAPADVRALLDGLDRGDEIEGWTVRAVRGPDERVINVEVEKAGVAFSVYVARRGALQFLPPRETERYALFYGGLVPADAGLPNATFEQVLGAIARRVEKVERSAPEPQGL